MFLKLFHFKSVNEEGLSWIEEKSDYDIISALVLMSVSPSVSGIDNKKRVVADLENFNEFQWN
jgi:hypothetical protein